MDINEDLLNFIIDNSDNLLIPEYDPLKHITTTLLIERLGITRAAAYQRLEILVKKGKLKKEWIRSERGYPTMGYYKD